MTDDNDLLHPIQQANALCGEGPVWDHRDERLYWIDLERPAAYRLDPANQTQTGNWPVESRIGMLALASENRILLATRERGVSWLHLDTGDITHLTHPAQDSGPGFYNDGRVDRCGRLWVGWITDERTSPGMIYRVNSDGSSVPAIDGVFASNGLGWSPDNGTMYFTDSTAGIVYSADFDLARGEVGARREFARFSREAGIPDGLAVDRDGYVWIALYQGWSLVRCSPSGQIVRHVRTPVMNPTSLCFGGEDLGTLYVTSAVRRHSARELLAQPMAGAVFAGRPGVHGLPEAVFG